MAPVELIGEASPKPEVPAEPMPPPPRMERPSDSHPPLPLRKGAHRSALAVVLAIAALAGAFAQRRLAGRTQAPTPLFERISFGRGYVGTARFGPDGQVLYTAAWEGRPPAVYAARVETRESRVVDAADRMLVGAARTGEIAYLDDRRTLIRARMDGGPSRNVLEQVRAADWAPDGSEFAVARAAEGRLQIEYPVGKPLCDAAWPSQLRLSPGRERVAFLEHPTRGDDRGAVVVVDLKGRRRVLTEDWASLEGLAWSPGGGEVWFTGARMGADSALYAVSLGGELRTLMPALGRLMIHDVAPDGRILLERSTMRQEVRYRGPGEAEERDLSWLDLPRVAVLSADGRHLVFTETGEGGGPDYSVFLRRTDGTMPVRLGHGRATDLSPDGRFVLSIPIRQADHIDILPTGAGETHILRDPGPGEYEWAAWLPDGKGIVYTRRGTGLDSRVYRRAVAAGPSQPVTPEGVGVWTNLLARDGRTLAVRCGEDLCFYPVEGGEPRRLPNPEARVPVAWGEEGILYVRDPPRIPARIHTLDSATGRTKPWKVLEPPDRTGVRGVNSVAITPDGRAYAYSYARELSDLYVVTKLR